MKKDFCQFKQGGYRYSHNESVIIVEAFRNIEKFLIFFFSSRRRHTICLSDWSSDVCSSDLSCCSLTGPAYSRNLASRVTLNRSEEHTSELQSLRHLVCRLLLEKKKK